MYPKDLVDTIHLAAAQRGLRIPMTGGRDLVSLLPDDRHHSAAIAATRAGNKRADRI